jgi:DNA-binding transcriptional regulator/RsmH inhibitor MraZ
LVIYVEKYRKIYYYPATPSGNTSFISKKCYHTLACEFCGLQMMIANVGQPEEMIEWQRTKLKFFAGNTKGKIESRDRLHMPLPYVDPNEREVVVTTSMHGRYLEVLPRWRYEQLYARLFKKLSMSFDEGFRNYADKELLDDLRDIVANHFRVTLDDSLRLSLPRELLDELGLKQGDEVMIVGFGEMTEIWPLAVWEAHKASRTNRDSSRVFSDAGSGAGATGGDAGAGSPSLDLN